MKFSAGKENAVLVTRQATGERLKAFNSIFGRRPDYPYEHEQPGGGEWLSEVANVPTVYVIYGNNKPTAREGGGGVSWRLSRHRVFFESKTAAIVGFEDGADSDFNVATVEISIEKVN